MKKTLLAVTAAGLLLMSSCKNNEMPTLTTQQDSLSWVMGQTIASGLVQTKAIAFNSEVVTAAIKHTLDGKPQPMDDQTVQSISEYIAFTLANHEIKQNQEQKTVAEDKEKGMFEKLLAEKPNLKKAPAGFYYEVIKEGKGKKADFAEVVTIDYRSFVMETGEKYDQTYGQRPPITTTVGNQMFPGLREGLQLMNAGSIYRFYFPSQLAFGAQALEGLPPYTAMIYEVELHEIGAKLVE